MKRLLLVFLFFTATHSIFGTHIIGGDLSYTCIGNKTYEFTLTIYSECGSVAVLEGFYPINYYSISQNIPINNPKNFLVTKLSEEEVTIFCKTVSTNCKSGSARGIKKVVYKGKVDLSAYPGAVDWNFYWKRAARSEEITTLEAPEDEDFFIELLMNNQAATCNNSPIFNSNPVLTACKGAVKTFNPLAVDPDGDQLVYSFVAPKVATDLEVTYKTGFDYNKFVSLSENAKINATTGDISFSATKVNEVGITDVLVKEYRNGVLIGSVRRGMQITTMDCSNKTPTLSNFVTAGKDSIAVCAGTKLELKINGADSDGQNVTLEQKTGKHGIFTAINNGTNAPTGEFVWQTHFADVGKHLFTIQAEDDGCPEPQLISKTYIIVVLSNPVFDLGENMNVKCDTMIKLAPKVTGGDGKYNYLWSNGATSATVIVPVGDYSLTVTDGKGCSSTDQIIINSGISPFFTAKPRCLGQPTVFKDSSSLKVGKIVSWEWKFGDGKTSKEQNPVHTYTKEGVYKAELTIIADNKCTSIYKQNITICAPPEVKFKNLDSCTNVLNPVRFLDLTKTEKDCEVIKRTWEWGDGSSTTFVYPFTAEEIHVYEQEGLKNVTLTVETKAGCTYSGSKTIRIYRSPEIKLLQNDYFFRCARPDTTLVSTVIYPGNGELTYQWNTGETTKNIDISSHGYYYLYVIDEYGGKDMEYVNIKYPLASNFVFTPLCKPGDAIHFTSTTTNHTGNPLLYEWNFGDGSPISNETSPSHVYPELKIYYPTLTIKDPKDGCESTNSFMFYNTYIIDTFAVFPKHISICVNNIVTGVGPEIDPKTDGLINSYEWDFGNNTFSNDRIGQSFYTKVGTYTVKLKVRYNAQAGFNDGCVKEYSDVINVFPEFRVDFDAFRVCVNDPVELSFRRTAGDLNIGLKHARWEIKESLNNQVTILTELRPVFNFKERQNYNVTLVAQDSVGCEFSITKSFFADVVALPNFVVDSICAKETTTFTADFRDTYENLTNIFWDFGGADTIRNYYSRPNIIKRSYEKGGSYPVTLTAYNSFTGCFQSVTKDVKVIDIPEVSFVSDTVCAGQSISFSNFTTIASGEVKAYLWEFHDGSISTEKNPKHLYPQPGYFKVRLTASSERGCADFLEKEVYIKEIPEADFQIEDRFLEAYVPLHFKDNSKGEVVAHFWDFGDGTTSTETDPIHQYEDVKIFQVKHIVFNDLGCSDTIVKKTNLNVRLDIPTAFTPNQDNINDVFGLIHHGIKELYEFKIYNRWGEVVFDAGTDKNALWDGTFKGKLQEVGVYVCYVKALGIYDTHFNFKKNISLLK